MVLHSTCSDHITHEHVYHESHPVQPAGADADCCLMTHACCSVLTILAVQLV